MIYERQDQVIFREISWFYSGEVFLTVGVAGSHFENHGYQQVEAENSDVVIPRPINTL